MVQIRNMKINKKLTEEEALRLIINYQLKPYGVDIDYVKLHPTINEFEWFYHYTFKTKQQYNRWKFFSYEMLKRCMPHLPKKEIAKEFSMIDLMWGLRHEYKD